MAARDFPSAAPGNEDGDDPIDPNDYNPKSVRIDVEAVKDLLLWARKNGFGMQVATVGQVQITNVVDHYSKPHVDRLRGRDGSGGGDEARSLSSEAEEEFATAEEREILNR